MDMAKHSPLAGAVSDLAAVMAEAPPGAADTLWRLTGAKRGLDAALVRLRPGAVSTRHGDPARDALVVVVHGSGRLGTGAGALPLALHAAVWLAGGSRESLTAGPDGMTYLTVRTRRPGPGVAPPAAEGGETACLLSQVCPDCGRLAAEQGARYCSRCGSPLPD
ncbi:hypothetical protein [Streptomyces sp. NPDC055287]